MQQKKQFLTSEGDAWFKRCHKNSLVRDYKKADPVVSALNKIYVSDHQINDNNRLLEIGCAGGKRLQYIQDNFEIEAFGVDPSQKAVKQANEYGVCAKQGTADDIPFPDNYFNILIFGFCLYLCDREDYPKIFSEADRITTDRAFVIIHDFYSNELVSNVYEHAEGICVTKMDFRKLFTSNNGYLCYDHTIYDHKSGLFTDIKENWVATSIMRKLQNPR